jgi:hypothetical protein
LLVRFIIFNPQIKNTAITSVRLDTVRKGVQMKKLMKHYPSYFKSVYIIEFDFRDWNFTPTLVIDESYFLFFSNLLRVPGTTPS